MGVGIITIFSLFIPILTYAQTTNVKDTGLVYDCELSHFYRFNGQKTLPGECTFEDLIYEVQNVVTFGRNLALELSVIVLVIAGFRYMISGDKPDERKKANAMLLNVVKGIIFIIAAWLIVKLITSALLKSTISTFMT